jgi:hypothetical protein
VFVASLESAGEHAGRTCVRESAGEFLMSRATAGRGIETRAPTVRKCKKRKELINDKLKLNWNLSQRSGRRPC